MPMRKNTNYKNKFKLFFLSPLLAPVTLVAIKIVSDDMVDMRKRAMKDEMKQNLEYERKMVLTLYHNFNLNSNID